MSTKQHINTIKNFLPNINSILEIQCGDGYDIENCTALQDKNLSYIGVDVRDDFIVDNRQYFRNEKNKIFMTLDASNEPLPKTDLIVCSGMAEYLPIANIWSLLENIRDSEAKYFAFDYYHGPIGNKAINGDIVLPEDEEEIKTHKPEKRAINLCQPPFYFPQPKILFPTEDINHSIALYEIPEVSLYMEWHNDDVSKLRMQILKKLDEAINVLKTSFDKESNGYEMLKEMCIKFLEIDAGTHNQKYYFDEPYKSIIDRIGALGTRNNIFRLVYKTELKNLQSEGYDFLNEDNFIHGQILAKDYIRWKFGLSLQID